MNKVLNLHNQITCVEHYRSSSEIERHFLNAKRVLCRQQQQCTFDVALRPAHVQKASQIVDDPVIFVCSPHFILY